MIVNKLSRNALKITLDRNDIARYGICSFDPDPDSVKAVLNDMYDDITKALDIASECHQIYAEVFSRPDRCLIFVSCKGIRKSGRVHSSEIICEFESFEALCDMCRSIFLMYPGFIVSSSLYCSGSIRLLLRLKRECTGLVDIAESYAKIIKADRINKAFTKEHFDLVIDKEAVSKVLMYEK